MVRRAFTLIELLVVISIIAILAAVLFPVFLSARSAAYQTVASGSLNQIGQAALMYCSDNDDSYMPAMYSDATHFQAWFGKWDSSNNVFTPGTGLLTPYQSKVKLKDWTAPTKPYLGDGSGFGYNWGFIGSDFHITDNYSNYPECTNEATSSGIAKPSSTVVFATSGYYFAPWLPKGDGQMYDFGFIDPIGYTNGNPNVDFRHIEPRIVNTKAQTIVFPGNAVIAMADGHIKSYKIGELKDVYFMRDSGGSGPGIDTTKLP